jgi:hypothetical protein
MKGLLVSVLRDAEYQGQPQQATENYSGFVLTGDGLPEIFTPSEDHPEMRLVPGNLPNTWKAVPASLDDVGWTMFGGHYVTTSDSRLSYVIGKPAVVPVHDRVESIAVTQLLSD